MISVRFGLMVAALILLMLSAFGVAHPRANLLAAGLALWVLAEILVMVR